MITSLPSGLRTSRRRVFGTALAALAPVALSVAGFAAPAAAAPLPTPTKVVVANVQWDRFSLNVGGATTQFYSVYLNGTLRIGLAQSSATLPITVGGLTQNTQYTVQVQRVNPPRFRDSSALSAPITVTTARFVAPALPASPSNVQAANVTSDSARLSWNAVAGATSYRVYNNGVLDQTVATTQATIAPTPLYPSGTTGGLRTGRANRVSVAAVVATGAQSIVTEIIVQTTGTAAPAPTAPTALTVTRSNNASLALTWAPSVEAGTDPTQLQYQFVVNGIVTGFTCQQYCFGTTSGVVGGLTPGTTYRIGVQAIGRTGAISDVVELTATTTAP